MKDQVALITGTQQVPGECLGGGGITPSRSETKRKPVRGG
jgi:hypothetical protein